MKDALLYFQLLTIISCLGCRPAVPTDKTQSDSEEAWFEDVTLVAGLHFQHVRNDTTRYWLPEIMSGGAAWIDYDGDGDQDAYLVQAGSFHSESSSNPGNVLFENLGNGQFLNVTETSGVGDTGYGMGVAVGDYDDDGDEDLYVTNVGTNVLYRNRGDGTFENATLIAGVGHDGWGTSAAFVDYDADGDLDLFVVNYIRWSPEQEVECFAGNNQQDYCTPNAYEAPAPDTLFQNNGDGTFRDVSTSVGLGTAYGNGLGVAVADFDQDGRLDIYVANDGTPNQLWLQESAGLFRDRALLSGCAVNRLGMSEAGMGVAAVDLENDGDLDLFMTHLGNESNTFYKNHDGIFDDVTIVLGLGGPSINYTGFGVVFADYNHDGNMDIYIANGRVESTRPPLVDSIPFAEPNQLFQGSPTGQFSLVLPTNTGSQLVENSRAVAQADYDGDGDMDLLIVNNGGQARLLSNLVGSRGNWIRFRVLTRHGGDALGARVEIETTAGAQWRIVQRAYSYQSSNEAYVHFGLANAEKVDYVAVHWPDGHEQTFGSCKVRELHTLRRGELDPDT